MDRIKVYIIFGIYMIILLGLLYIMGRYFSATKRFLRLQYKIITPILLILSLVKLIKFNQLFGSNNFYFLLFIISLFFIFLELIIKLLTRYFTCYSKHGLFSDEIRWRYSFFICIATISMTFISLATTLLFINDFIINLRP